MSTLLIHISNPDLCAELMIIRIFRCLLQLETSESHPKLKILKTELLHFLPSLASLAAYTSLVNDSLVLLVGQAKNLGIILDTGFSLIDCIESYSKSCWLYLQNIHRIPPVFITFTYVTLVQASIIS